MKTKNNKKNLDSIKWYSFFNGPDNVFQLATLLKRRKLYDVIYKPYSDPVHGSNLAQGVFSKSEDGWVTFNQIRILDEAPLSTYFALVIGLDIYQIVIGKILPREKQGFSKWGLMFNKEFIDPLKKLTDE